MYVLSVSLISTRGDRALFLQHTKINILSFFFVLHKTLKMREKEK